MRQQNCTAGKTAGTELKICGGRKQKNAIGDTQPIKVSSHTKPLRVSSDTQPIRIPSWAKAGQVSASYRGRYQQAVSRRRKEISGTKTRGAA